MDKDWPGSPKSQEASTSLMGEFAGTLEALESALGEAMRNAAQLKTVVPRVAALERVLTELEATMARARERVAPPAAPSPPSAEPGPSLWPVPSAEAPEAPAEAEPPSPAEETPPEAADTDRRSFVIEVTAGEGSLDLKDVDRSVNDNPGVADVALLDFDGRKASLKIWVNEEADLSEVHELLREGLKNNLAAEGKAGDISVSLSEQSAA
jgi:hypothetical protein